MSDDLLERMTARYAHLAPDLWVADVGVFRVKTVGDAHIDVLPLMFTAAIVTTPVGQARGYTDRWCYATIAAAVDAARTWPGEVGTEPDGWHRHPVSGRRRHGGIETVEL